MVKYGFVCFKMMCLVKGELKKIMTGKLDINEEYAKWVSRAEDDQIKNELESIKNNAREIKERFHKSIEFGTAGLRGVMGAGTNRINIYTVRRATQGLANFLTEKYLSDISVAISYDSRNNSGLFVKETAKVLAGNGIKSYITDKLMPTPFLSFCVRNLKAQAGVMITASHNTAEYNGYKCYGEDGAQMSEDIASKVFEKINSLNIFSDTKILDFEVAKSLGLIEFVAPSVYEEYEKHVMDQRIFNFPISNLNVVYTPLNGAGNIPVSKVLKKAGVKDLYVVSSQENPDGNFTTCTYPNPENIEAFSEALKVAKEKDADIILATDPDCDRLGVCVKHGSEYKILSGNEIGVLIFNYILSKRKEAKTLPKKPVAIKSIVSTMMVDGIARNYGCEMREVLTGFKNIASEILKLEKEERENDYVFGFEESNGYLTGAYVRDKDAVSAALVVSEMAACYKDEGMNLCEALEKLYNRYGFFGEKTLGFEVKGVDGGKIIEDIMGRLKNNFSNELKGLDILKVYDYLNSTVFDSRNGKVINEDLPHSNIIRFDLKDNCKIIVRPSGTEPKIKFYLIMQANSRENLEIYKSTAKKIVERIMEK